MEHYITFIRNMEKGEEFIATYRAPAGAHEEVVRAQMRKYPLPTYRVHTAYTVAELKDIMDTLTRWAVPANQARTAGTSRGSVSPLAQMSAPKPSTSKWR